MQKQDSAEKENIRKSKINCLLAVLLIGATIGIIIIVAKLMIYGSFRMDNVASDYVKHIKTKRLDAIAEFITASGDFSSVLIISLLIMITFFILKKMKDGLYYGFNVLGIWGFNELLKAIFKRERPSGIHLVYAAGYSFPSGHAMIFSGLGLILIYFIFINSKIATIKAITIIFIFIYILLVGLSRVYANVHFLSDVIGGFFFSIIWVSISLYFYNYHKINKTN